ncbi:ABC transporter permease subunit [Anoxybacteroides tepidamans]|uniref:ABC transporter permease subunit n=1 Tax=Anoxybacteroides tepidamans TaxID=265948 RepID=UPI0004846999|nr:ABC transporter permease subunit [Anoxybacillus tepidamans]
MNAALYKNMLKVYGKTIISYSVGSALYLLLIIGIYPSIAKSKGMEQMLQQMPKQLLKAFDLHTGIGTIEQFMAGEYYSLLFLLILSVYCVLIANQLMARLIDRGAIAYLLATPNSRRTIATTQAFVLLTGVIAIVAAIIVAGIVGTRWLAADHALNHAAFLKMNMVGMLLFFAVSGYSFFFSAIVSDEKQALALSGGITFLFYSFDLAGKLTEKLEWLRHFSLFSAFRPAEIVQGQTELLPVCVLLGAVGLISYIAAIIAFSKRDLAV